MSRLWKVTLVVSVGTVVALMGYANYVNWHDGVPLGFDSYYYVGFINQVVTAGPLSFAAGRHYVEFLYPILGSIPVYLGATPEAVEIVLPILMAALAVAAAAALLSLEARERKVQVVGVALLTGWFAIYRMAADFQGNLLALLFLLLATTILARVSRVGQVTPKTIGVFFLLVGFAAAAHVETTDFFILSWLLAMLLAGPRFWKVSRQSGSILIYSSVLVALPFTLSYVGGSAGGSGGQYCPLPVYWLEVLGPLIALVVIGIGVAGWKYAALGERSFFTRNLLAWSLLAIIVGALGYVSNFPLVYSDRALLLLPVPFAASYGVVWLAEALPIARATNPRLLLVLSVITPVLLGLLVFTYAGVHFRYFPVHYPVTCGGAQ